jgi:hypothetical protein
VALLLSGAAATKPPRLNTLPCKDGLQPLPWVKANAMPIGGSSIYMILRRLAKVKLCKRADWWFSTSWSGGFGPGGSE